MFVSTLLAYISVKATFFDPLWDPVIGPRPRTRTPSHTLVMVSAKVFCGSDSDNDNQDNC